MIGKALSHTVLHWVLAAVFSLVFTPICAATESFNLREIAPGVFVHLGKQLALDAPGHDDIANIGFIVGVRCVAIIDTGGSVRVGRALRAAVNAKTSLPICYVMNTHVHVDHVLGNVAFKGDKPSFVGHEGLAAAMVGNREFFLKNYSADLDRPAGAGQIVAPDRGVTIGSEVTLDLGGRHLILHAWPKAHTDCDLSVYDEKTGTLWTGDLLFRERLPALDGSVTGWIAALDELARMQVRMVVPGHGGTANNLTTALDPERRYLQSLLDGVRAAIARGTPMQTAIEQVGKGEQSGWLLWEQTQPHNVARAYQQLEWE